MAEDEADTTPERTVDSGNEDPPETVERRRPAATQARTIGEEAGPARWEIILSGVSTLVLTVAAILQEDLATLAKTVQSLGTAKMPAWLLAVLAVPAPVLWALTAVLGAALFWLAMRYSKRYGAPVLFGPPVIMLALPYLLTWLLYGPIRAVNGAAHF